jgi:hypothetical protein
MVTSKVNSRDGGYNHDMSKPTELAREAATLNDVEWFDFLDEIDEVARQRQKHPEPEPDGKDRDAIAEWVAKRHLIADSTIKEIWYLPTGAPPDEIRLIEANGRLAGVGWGIETIDFPLDVDGARFSLLVADTTSDELQEAQKNPSHLPPGWSLSGAKVWRRGK